MTRPKSQIRKLAAGDLDEVAALVQRGIRSGGRPPVGLKEALARTYLDAPDARDGSHSLVYEDSEGSIRAFLGVMGRKLQLEDETLSLACSGPLVLDPDAPQPGVGLLLTRALFRDGWDAAITDGATQDAVDLWKSLGGVAPEIYSVQWTKVLRPTAHARRVLQGHPRFQRAPWKWIPRSLGLVEAGVDAALASLRGSDEGAESIQELEEPLTPERLVDLLSRLQRSWRLRPVYAVESLRWLFGEIGRLSCRGDLRGSVVSNEKGNPVGWFLYTLVPGGIGHVLQAAATSGSESLVLSRLFADARRGGAVAVDGRAEPRLLRALAEHSVGLRCAPPYSVLWTRRDDLLTALLRGDGLLTRLDAEWWLAFHLEAYR